MSNSNIIINKNLPSTRSSRNAGWLTIRISTFVSQIVIAISVPGCSTEPSADNSAVSLVTTRSNYFTSDTVQVKIINESPDTYSFGLRCGEYLEMFYQQKIDVEWSEDKWLFYMSYLCPTLIDSIQTGEDFTYNLPAEWFEEVGTFQISIGELYSNKFRIE